MTTGEYGSQMLSLGGVHHLTGGSKKEGRMTCEALLALCNKQAVELAVDDGSSRIVRPGRRAADLDGRRASHRVARLAAIGMFAKQWFEHVDEGRVVDDHITGVLSEHQSRQASL